MLATLAEYGMVRESAASDEYVLTERVRQLSDGFTERDRTTQIVSAHLGTLFQKVLWPTDFATFDQGAMVIRETTHRFSPYSVYRAMVGRPRPMLTSALGRAALAGASAQQREALLDITCGAIGESRAAVAGQVEQLLSEYATLGYSWSAGPRESRTSAIGVAVRTGTPVAAALNLVFFRSAMSIETAAKRYIEPMKICAAQIEASLREDVSGSPAFEGAAAAEGVNLR